MKLAIFYFCMILFDAILTFTKTQMHVTFTTFDAALMSVFLSRKTFFHVCLSRQYNLV